MCKSDGGMDVVPNSEAQVVFPNQLVSTERPLQRNLLLERDYTRIGAAGALRAEPPELRFAASEQGGTMVQILRLVNFSAKPVRLHILPPSTPFFSISVDKRGRLMPGLAEEVTVRFMPVSECYQTYDPSLSFPEPNLPPPQPPLPPPRTCACMRHCSQPNLIPPPLD